MALRRSEIQVAKLRATLWHVRRKPLECSGCHYGGIGWLCRRTTSQAFRILPGSALVVSGPGFGAAGREQEVTTKSQASGIMSSRCGIRSSAGRSRHAGDVHRSVRAAAGAPLSLFEDGALLLGQICGRRGLPCCVCARPCLFLER